MATPIMVAGRAPSPDRCRGQLPAVPAWPSDGPRPWWQLEGPLDTVDAPVHVAARAAPIGRPLRGDDPPTDAAGARHHPDLAGALQRCGQGQQEPHQHREGNEPDPGPKEAGMGERGPDRHEHDTGGHQRIQQPGAELPEPLLSRHGAFCQPRVIAATPRTANTGTADGAVAPRASARGSSCSARRGIGGTARTAVWPAGGPRRRRRPSRTAPAPPGESDSHADTPSR